MTEPFAPATRDRLYTSKAKYLSRFDAALSRTIAANFILPTDHDEILAIARETPW